MDNFIIGSGIIFLVPFFWRYLKMILSYRAGRYGNLDTLNSNIRPLFQILDTEPGWCNNSGGGGGAAGGVQFY